MTYQRDAKKILSYHGIMDDAVNAFTDNNTTLLVKRDNITVSRKFPLWLIAGKGLPLHELLMAQILYKILQGTLADNDTIKKALDENPLNLNQKNKDALKDKLQALELSMRSLSPEKAIEFIVQKNVLLLL